MIATTDTVIVHRATDRASIRAIDRALARLRRVIRRVDEAPWVDLGGES